MKPTHTIDFLSCLVNVEICKWGYVRDIESDAKIKTCPRCGCFLFETYQLTPDGSKVWCLTPNCDSWSVKPI